MEICSQDYLMYDVLGMDEDETLDGYDEVQVCAGSWRRLGQTDNWYFDPNPEWNA